MSVQNSIDRLNAIKARIRTNLVAQGITVPEDSVLEEMAEQILSVSGEKGEPGEQGVGVETVEQTTTSTADDGNNIITITLTNGSKHTFQVQNGSKGSQGNPGKDGAAGADGKTPVKGVDYFTDAEKAEMVSEAAAAIPIGDYVPKSGGTMNGYLTLNEDPEEELHAATKRYVDLKTKGSNPIRFGYALPATGEEGDIFILLDEEGVSYE